MRFHGKGQIMRRINYGYNPKSLHPKPEKKKEPRRTMYPCPKCGSNDTDKLRIDWWWCRECGKEYDPEMK